MGTVAQASVKSDESVGLTLPASWAGWFGLSVVVGAGLVLRLREAWQTMPDLVVNTLPDDAFYYFQIARNITHGNAVTLDGETVTSGFHPLWLALITPLFVFDDRTTAAHMALTLGAVLGATTVVLVYLIIERLTERWPAALLGAGFFSLHPAIVMYSVNGLETAVALATLALVCLLFIVMAKKPPDAISIRDYAVLGVALGLMVLSRTDSLLVIPAVLGYLAWRGGRVHLRGPIVAGVIAAVGLVAWVGWCLVATGSPMQDSAVAGGLLRRQAYLDAGGDSLSFRIEKGWEVMRETFVDKLPTQFMVPILDDPTPFWLFVGLTTVLVLIVPSPARRKALGAAGLILVPFSGMFLVLMYESAIRWFVRDWYYAPYALLAAVLIGIVASWVEGTAVSVREWVLDRRGGGVTHGTRRLIRVGVVAGVYGLLALGLVRLYGPQEEGYIFRYSWQTAVLEATTYLRLETDPEVRVAAYNAGIPSYLSERTVVNLDGVVNRDAYEAARDCRTRDYLREMRIDLVAEVRGQFLLAHCGLTFDVDVEEVTQVGAPDPVYILVPVDRK